jgi:hypothetical protein
VTFNPDSKSNKRRLRALAGTAYTRELGNELANLEIDFSRWRRGEIDPFELSDRIHRFHEGVSRDLYVTYRDLPPDQAVARAVAFGVLERVEVPADLLAAIEQAIQFFGEREEPAGEQAEEDSDD